jgi:hypothetical protein
MPALQYAKIELHAAKIITKWTLRLTEMETPGSVPGVLLFEGREARGVVESELVLSV